MKRITIGAALLLAGILIATTLPKAGAEGRIATSRHDVVIIQTRQFTQDTDPRALGYGEDYQYVGMEAYCVSSSKFAPQFRVPTFSHSGGVDDTNAPIQVADVVAQLLDEGFRASPTTIIAGGTMFIRTH